MEKKLKEELWQILKSFEDKACTMNHYELAKETEHTAETWKTFLTELDVVRWRDEELQVIRTTELAKLQHNISNSRSVGHAQLMNAIQKINNESSDKSGPVIIYCYVPLDDNQQQADNVIVLDEDIFAKKSINTVKDSDIFVK